MRVLSRVEATRLLRGLPNLFGLWVWNQLYAIDVYANTFIGGDRRHTISSRAGKGLSANQPIHSIVAHCIDLFFWILFREPDHCLSSVSELDDKYSISTRLSEILDGSHFSRRA